MSEMVERVARAIYEDDFGGPDRTPTPWAERDEEFRETVRSNARAAIQAMREPTSAMVEAADSRRDPRNGWLGAISAWEAMIDAALKE